MRLIDADALFALFSEQHTHNKQLGQDVVAKGWQGALQLLYDAPTIDPIRAAGGCYCRECKHCKGADKNQALNCGLNSMGIQTGLPFITPNDFCNYGEPKEAQDGE